jgi:proteasome-associated ATPase
MDRYEVRKKIAKAFARRSKADFYKLIQMADSSSVGDVLWEYMEETDDGSVAKRELEVLREKIKELGNKSGQRVRCIKALDDRRALIQLGPLKEEVMVSPEVDMRQLTPGAEVLVVGSQEGRLIAAVREPAIYDGRLTKVQRIIDEGRIVIESGGHELILKLADWVTCKEGDEIRYDLESQMVLEVISSREKSAYTLSDKPTQTFEHVKGLEEEKKYMYERIIYPSIHKDTFQKYGLKSIRGALFHGPPGCGKTFIAGAIFNEMIKLKENEGATLKEKTDYSGFFVINGPEVLSKWAGNTESAIRKIFEEAREAGKTTGFPSIIFWDEIESIAGRRKDTATYTPEKTVVPTLLAELQGLEQDQDIILIGATNRPDLVDPALLRPGRLGDAILEIPRPEKEAAMDILKMEFGRQIPDSLAELINQGLPERLAAHVYDNTEPLAYARTKSGKQTPIMRQELVSGALFSQIGEELVRNTCIADIDQEVAPTVEQSIEMVDHMLLTQIGVLDAGVKSGFTLDISDYVIDVSVNA